MEPNNGLSPQTQAPIQPPVQPTAPVAPPVIPPVTSPAPAVIMHEPRNTTAPLIFILVTVIVLLAAVIAVMYAKYGHTASLQSSVENNNQVATTGCTTNDYDCFFRAVSTCTPTTLTTLHSGVSLKHEIAGPSGSLCHYIETNLGGKVTPTPQAIAKAKASGVTQAELDQGVQFFQGIVDATAGTVQDCTGTPADITTIVQELRAQAIALENGDESTTSSNSPGAQFMANHCTVSRPQ